MAAGITLIPIIPKKPVTSFNKATVVGALLKVGLNTVRTASTYPPSQTEYRRTGELGRRWTLRGPSTLGAILFVEVGNNLEYASRVMGLKVGEASQLDKFRQLGWRSIEDIGREEVDKARPFIIKALQGK